MFTSHVDANGAPVTVTGPDADLSDLSDEDASVQSLSWQESMLATKTKELGGSRYGPFGGAGTNGKKDKKLPTPLEFDPKSLEIWNRFFENATVLNQVKNGGTVNGMRVYKVPQVAGYEWPDLPSEKRFHKIIKTTLGQPESPIRNVNLSTSLLYATMFCDAEAVEMLLSLGAEPNCTDSQSRTPAHYASKLNSPAMLDSIVEYGGDVESVDATGRTPLHTATVYGSSEAVKYLLESAVPVDSADKEGNTSLHLVSHCGIKAVEISNLLLDYGADTSITNACNMSPHNYAEAVNDISQSRDLKDLSRLLKDRAVKDSLEDEEPRGDYLRASTSLEDPGGLIQGVFDLTLNTAGSLIKFAIDTLGADEPPPPPPPEDE
jgi:hypothetical protein